MEWGARARARWRWHACRWGGVQASVSVSACVSLGLGLGPDHAKLDERTLGTRTHVAADAAELFCAFKQEHRHQAANKWDTYRQHLLLRCEPWPTATCVGVATWHGVTVAIDEPISLLGRAEAFISLARLLYGTACFKEERTPKSHPLGSINKWQRSSRLEVAMMTISYHSLAVTRSRPDLARYRSTFQVILIGAWCLRWRPVATRAGVYIMHLAWKPGHGLPSIAPAYVKKGCHSASHRSLIVTVNRKYCGWARLVPSRTGACSI
eukprot:scaffold5074_cov34-Tisochrysis_lutea.AAC.3